jgi:glutamine cyclotransferase
MAANCAQPLAMDWAIEQTRELPPELYVQGFAIEGGRWYLSGGGYGQSQVQILPAPGQPWRRLKQPLSPRLFAEGLGLRQDELWLLTWQAGQVLVLSAQTLELRGQHRYQGQGWGLDWDAQAEAWVMSDGSAILRWRSGADFSVRRQLQVRDDQGPLSRLNELEHTAHGLWANQWQEDHLLLINTRSGCVQARLALEPMWPATQRPRRAEVLNGIAYDSDSGLLWVTGKYWGRAFGLRLAALSQPSDSGVHANDP